MPNESILFAPEIDERQLDKETQNVNDQLAGVGEDVPVSFDPDEIDMDGLTPAGGGGGGSAGPSKSDLAMLGIQERTLKYQKQSAEEDTVRNQILEQWGGTLEAIHERIRAIGGQGQTQLEGATTPAGGDGGVGAGDVAIGNELRKRLPKSVAGVTATAAIPIAIAGGVGAGMLSAMQSSSARMQTSSKLLGIAVDNFFREPGNIFDKHVTRPIVNGILGMSLEWSEGLQTFSGALASDGIIPDDLGNVAERMRGLGQAIGALPFPKFRLLGSGMERAADMIDDFEMPTFPSFPEMPDAPEFPTMPDAPTFPDIPTPQTPDWRGLRPDMPDFSGIDLNLPSWLQRWTSGSPTVDSGTSGGDLGIPDESDLQGPGGFYGDVPAAQSGGRVRSTGVAEIHRGELVSDPDRLVSELASAVSQATGGRSRGRGASMDTSTMERKLDELNRNVRRLANSLSVEGVGPEEIARLSSNGQRNGIADSNPKV